MAPRSGDHENRPGSAFHAQAVNGGRHHRQSAQRSSRLAGPKEVLHDLGGDPAPQQPRRSCTETGAARTRSRCGPATDAPAGRRWRRTSEPQREHPRIDEHIVAVQQPVFLVQVIAVEAEQIGVGGNLPRPRLRPRPIHVLAWTDATNLRRAARSSCRNPSASPIRNVVFPVHRRLLAAAENTGVIGAPTRISRRCGVPAPTDIEPNQKLNRPRSRTPTPVATEVSTESA